jgi:hypothetical protein
MGMVGSNVFMEILAIESALKPAIGNLCEYSKKVGSQSAGLPATSKDMSKPTLLMRISVGALIKPLLLGSQL